MKINGKLPKGDNDGISALESQLIKDTDRHVAALVIFDVMKKEIDIDTDESTVTLRLRRIEPILKDDKPTASQLIARAYEARTGAATLPIDLENEIRDAISGPDIYQPEHEAPTVAKGSPYGVMGITELRDELRRRGLDSEGKKADLVDRLISDDQKLAPELPDEPPLSSPPAVSEAPTDDELAAAEAISAMAESEPPASLPEAAVDPSVAFSDSGVNWNPEPGPEVEPWGTGYPEGQ